MNIIFQIILLSLVDITDEIFHDIKLIYYAHFLIFYICDHRHQLINYISCSIINDYMALIKLSIPNDTLLKIKLLNLVGIVSVNILLTKIGTHN